MNNLVKKLSLVFAAGCFGGLLNSPASCSESLQLGEWVGPDAPETEFLLNRPPYRPGAHQFPAVLLADETVIEDPVIRVPGPAFCPYVVLIKSFRQKVDFQLCQNRCV